MKKWTKFITLMASVLFFIGCQKITGQSPANSSTPLAQATQSTSSLIAGNVASTLPPDARLVDIRKVNNKIALDMRYATTNNFFKQKFYPVSRCVLRGAAATRLSQVQNDLSRNGLGLKVYDCYRPLSIQKKMWQVMPDSRFVANPANGSRHNRGAAVDLTLIDRNGKELEMPTGFDNFTERAYTNYSGGTSQSRNNRQILQNAMKKYGFIPLETEWWHFDAPGWDKFSVLDVSFGEIP